MTKLVIDIVNGNIVEDIREFSERLITLSFMTIVGDLGP